MKRTSRFWKCGKNGKELVAFILHILVPHSGGYEIGFQRLFFSEPADAHDAEADDVTLGVHPLHHGIVIGFLLVAGDIREADLQESASASNQTFSLSAIICLLFLVYQSDMR